MPCQAAKDIYSIKGDDLYLNDIYVGGILAIFPTYVMYYDINRCVRNAYI